MAIVTAKNGKTPQNGSILVQKGEKGIWLDCLAEGRHFLNPINFDVKIVPAINIPIGKVGIVTSKIGKPLNDGEIIAPDRSYQGVWRNVLGPGLYRLNPQGYDIKIEDAINIPIGYIGVVTSQTGKRAKPGNFAKMGEKGIFEDILQPGLYYINPRAYQVNVIEIGMNQVTMNGTQGSIIKVKNKISSASSALETMSRNTLNQQQILRENYINENKSKLNIKSILPQKSYKTSKKLMVRGDSTQSNDAGIMPKPSVEDNDTAVMYSIKNVVEFPSIDGFRIMMDMTVEFELMPGKVSKIYMLYGDLPKVVEKILLPQILSASRIKGSSYKAQDFIMGDGREKFQNDLRLELVNTMAKKSIIIHNAIIRNVSIPENILKPIQDSSLASEQNLTNISLQETAKRKAELNTQTALINQKEEEVSQETKKLVAEIAANREKEVKIIESQTELEVAQINLEKSKIEAKKEKLIGETDVKAEFIQKNEIALGTQMKAEALGKLASMADLQLIENLSPRLKINILHAGEGTLWTDMQKGSLTIPAIKK